MAEDLRFLRHMGLRGERHIHPRGVVGTRRLLDALELRGARRVLEVGCGTGATLVEIASRYPVRLEGVDVLPEMLDAGHRRVRWAGRRKQIGLVRARGHRLPMADASYDRVYVESVLGIQSESAALGMLREIHRVLRPGGRVVANEAVWRAGTTGEQARSINQRCVDRFGLPQASPEPWTARDWIVRMSGVGFDPVSVEALKGKPDVAVSPGSLRPRLASRALTLWLGVRAYASPTYLAELRRYRRALVEVRGLGEAVEAVLFVMDKPGGPGAEA